MVKKALSLILVSFMSFTIMVKPFNIHADDYNSDTILGYQYHLKDVDVDNIGTGTTSNVKTFFIYDIEFTLNDYYVGSITLDITVSADGSNYRTTKYSYVNGTSFTVPFYIESTGTYGDSYQPDVYGLTYSVTSSNLHVVNSYNFPIESFNIQSFAFSNLEYEGFLNDSDYQYGIFNLHQNDEMYRSYGVAGRLYWVIFICDRNIYNASVVPNFISFTNATFNTFNFYTRFYYKGNLTYIYRMSFYVDSSGQFALKYINSADAIYMPIYCNEDGYKYLSTDFALRYNLSNKLLDNIQALVDGTSESSETAADSNAINSDLETASDSLFTQEDSFKNDMNNAMQNIDTTFSLNNFGQSFVKSSNWVKTQFENLTNNTPFQTLITFSLLIGLSMIVLGKVYR